jgi:hypothetical protein
MTDLSTLVLRGFVHLVGFLRGSSLLLGKRDGTSSTWRRAAGGVASVV